MLALYIEPAWLERVDPWFGASARRDFFPSPCVPVPRHIRVLSLQLAEELQGPRAGAVRACSLARRIMVERGPGLRLRTDEAIGSIGAALGFSAHAHFTRFFRESHGVSPDAYRRAAWRIEA